MDFTFTADEEEAAALAATILRDHSTPERLRALETAAAAGAHDGRFDRALWSALAAADLLRLGLPEADGGVGLGLIATTRVLVEAGRAVAAVPLAAHLPAIAFAARWAPEPLRGLLLPAAGRGDLVVTAAAAAPGLTARPDGTGIRLDGTLATVPAGTVADWFLVPVTTADGPAVFALAPGDPGVTVEPQRLSGADVAARLVLDAVPVDARRRCGAPGSAASAELTALVTLAVCAVQLGVTEQAIRLTAGYASQREQFGRPIGTFQAVRQRLADGWIDVTAQRLTLWQAVWRLQEGLPCTAEVATAAFWAAEAGHRAGHSAVHVHGGVGLDLDGTAHRYFTAAKRHEFALGGAHRQALTITQAITP